MREKERERKEKKREKRQKERNTFKLVTYPSGGHPAAASARATTDVAAAAAVRARERWAERARDC